MTCPSCADHGIFRVNYHEDKGADPDFALCLCKAGERVRATTNNGKATHPLWHIWAHQHGVPFDRVAPMEDLLTPEEMAERGFSELSPASSLDAIAAAAKARKAKR